MDGLWGPGDPSLSSSPADPLHTSHDDPLWPMNTPSYSSTSGPLCLLFPLPGMLFSGLFARLPSSHPSGFSLNATSPVKPSQTIQKESIPVILPSPCSFPSENSQQPYFFYFSVQVFTAWACYQRQVHVPTAPWGQTETSKSGAEKDLLQGQARRMGWLAPKKTLHSPKGFSKAHLKAGKGGGSQGMWSPRAQSSDWLMLR